MPHGSIALGSIGVFGQVGWVFGDDGVLDGPEGASGDDGAVKGEVGVVPGVDMFGGSCVDDPVT